MFLLPPRVRDLFEKRPKGSIRRAFSRDELLVRKVREMAVSQRRAEQEVYDDIIESGMKVLSDKDKYEDIWTSLSPREQEVTALTCLGYRSYEIAGALGISYETVRTSLEARLCQVRPESKRAASGARALELRGVVGRPPGLGALLPSQAISGSLRNHPRNHSNIPCRGFFV